MDIKLLLAGFAIFLVIQLLVKRYYEKRQVNLLQEIIRIITALIFAFGAYWILNTYVLNRWVNAPEQEGVIKIEAEAEAKAGEPVKVPAKRDLYKPLNLEIKMDEQAAEGEKIVVVETDLYVANFSNDGGALVSLAYKKHKNKKQQPLQSIHYNAQMKAIERKQAAFLLSFEDKTPTAYECVAQHADADKTTLTFKAAHAGWNIVKSFIFHNDSYVIDAQLSFHPQRENIEPLQPRLVLPMPLMYELKDEQAEIIAWEEHKASLNKYSPANATGLAWYWKAERPLFGAENRYFVHAAIGDAQGFIQRAFVAPTKAYLVRLADNKKTPTAWMMTANPQAVDTAVRQIDAAPREVTICLLEGPTISTAANYTVSFYMGPKTTEALISADARLEELLSFGWFSTICKLLLKLLTYLNDMLGNFGLAIIALTLIIKLLFAPLSMYGRQKMEEQQRYQGSINKIRAKYKNDMVTMQAEIMRFYKEHNISPTASIFGCLPMLIQLVVMFALYRVLNNYIGLYQAPFAGWLNDLSVADPFYVLPVLMGLTMLWHQTLSPMGDSKQRAMMYFMPLIMTAVFINFPAGLVLFWFAQNVLIVAEEYLRKAIFRKSN
jgi:YidC/Oxa1 family membrane protein insertase